MRLLWVHLLVMLPAPAAAVACMRPQMDERAVQWSSAIVEARLMSIRPDVVLGQIQERQGALGVLGVSTTTYLYRLYEFRVTRALDGELKEGQTFPVIRLFSRVEQRNLLQQSGGCGQHLGPNGIGKDFLLLVRPLTQFKNIVPNGIDPPAVKNAMWVVHLGTKDSLAPSAVEELKATIQGVHAAAQQATPERVGHLISQIAAAGTDARAGPSIRALERIGPSVLPAVEKAVASESDPLARNRLTQIVIDLTPPQPIIMIETQHPVQEP
jgi:hypothetical protein